MSAILQVELVGVHAPPPIPYKLGEGVNYLTLAWRVPFYTNECNWGRDANP